MIFARNSDREILIPRADGVKEQLQNQTPPYIDNFRNHISTRAINTVAQDYEFKEVEIISEEQAYAHYRIKKMQRLQMFNVQKQDTQNTIDSRYTGALTKQNNTVPMKTIADITFKVGLVDIYIIPKLYNYFPFLDCDTKDQYDDCCSHLESDGVQFVSYLSSNRAGKYWIFCDKAMDFDDTIQFIKQYPADGRYSWIAEYKREFCVRAIPKYAMVPKRIPTDDSDLSRDFKFWLECFDDYWANSKLIQYIMLDEVVDNI